MQAVSPSCHTDSGGRAAPPGAPVVALVGAPNVGKSTLFNALTGARRDTGNWPGTSVAVGTGAWRLAGGEVSVVDLPGAYSLDPMSPDEALTRELLLETPDADRPDLIVVVLDAGALSRSLYMLAQVRERAGSVVAVLTMADVASRRGLTVDLARLEAAAGVPVIALDPRRREGAERLGRAVTAALHEVVPPARTRCSSLPAEAAAHEAIADDPLAEADERFAWIDGVVEQSVRRSPSAGTTRSDRIDRIATSPVSGPLLFLGVMWLVFQTTTSVAGPMQAGLGGLLHGPVTSGVRGLLELAGLGHTLFSRFLVDGLLSGVGMLLTFVPLMALMFGMLALLEDSGYLARAAVVTDRMMRAVGLPGRAFLPLVVGFGCNVPAVSGTRVLPDARHRLLTTLLVPFTSCSARLTVYVLVATIFFPGHAGTVVFVMYVLSIAFVVAVGLLLRNTALRRIPSEPLVLDLPPYHLPVPRLALQVTWTRLRGFLSTASGIIVGAVAVGLGDAGGPGHRWLRGRAGPGRAQPVRRDRTDRRPGVRTGRIRRLARDQRADDGFRRQGGGHLVLVADLRGPAVGPESRPAADDRRRSARAGRDRGLRAVLGRSPQRSGVGVPGLPARVHPMCGDPCGPAPRDRPALDSVRRGPATGRRVDGGGRRVPGRAMDRVTGGSTDADTALTRQAGGPLRAVLAAVNSGAVTVADIALRTGLDRDVVAAAVQHLIRAGRIGTAALSSGCPASACAGCGLACPQ